MKSNRQDLKLIPADITYREAVDRGDIDPDETRDWQHGYAIGQGIIKKRRMKSNLLIVAAALLITWLCSTLAKCDERAEVQRIVKQWRSVTERAELGELKSIEHRLPDGTRVDLLTTTHAVEVDWARKWAEGIGQCLYYAIITQRKPALVLLLNDDREQRYVKRAAVVCHKYGIKLVTVKTKPKE